MFKLRFVLPCLIASVLATGAGASAQSRFALLNGDVNGDFERDISDGIFLLSHLFLSGPPPVRLQPLEDGEPVIRNGDVNGDRVVDLSDAISLLNWLYASGAEPVLPYVVSEGAGGMATVSTTTTHRLDFSDTRTNPCTGEEISSAGRINSVSHTTMVNGKFQLVFLISWAGLEATAEPSGDSYRALNATRFFAHFDEAGLDSVFTSRVHFVNTDGTGDFIRYVTVVLQVNANGETTVSINPSGSPRIECLGR